MQIQKCAHAQGKKIMYKSKNKVGVNTFLLRTEFRWGHTTNRPARERLLQSLQAKTRSPSSMTLIWNPEWPEVSVLGSCNTPLFMQIYKICDGEICKVCELHWQPVKAAICSFVLDTLRIWQLRSHETTISTRENTICKSNLGHFREI